MSRRFSSLESPSRSQRMLSETEWRKGDKAEVLHLDYPVFWPHGGKLPFTPTVRVGGIYDVMGVDVLTPYSPINPTDNPVLVVKLFDEDAEITCYHEARLRRIPQ